MANPAAMTGMLGQQLANISDTLARASRRRDAEVQRRTASKSSAAPAVQAPAAPSPTKPSLTSNTEDSASGNSVVFIGHQKNFNTQVFSRFDLDQPQANRIMGWIRSMPATVHGHTNVLIDDTTSCPSLRGGYRSDDDDDDDEDVRKMRTHFAETDPPIDAHETDPKHILAQLDRTNSVINAGENLDPKKLQAELAQLDSLRAVRTEARDNDVASMVADLNRTSTVAGRDIVYGKTGDVTLKQMLAEFGASTSPAGDEVTICSSRDIDPVAILTKLERETYLFDDDDPKRMLADLQRRSPSGGQEPADDSDDDMEVLRGRLVNMFSPAPDSTASFDLVNGKPDAVIDPAVMPYIIALQLESAGLPWDEAQGWTKYLFSTGFDGHKARQAKDKIVEQAAQDLDKFIEQVLHEEKQYLAMDNEVRRPCRLLVSNIAMGACEEDLKEFFPYQFRHSM
jgi:hypothetical protein